ncbi:MAG: HAMP domain-containing histidine kinase [Lachnospiraceae bacterium]|nr:HAMP domain-containing histidine kinase [Lachnospiraceae bacterium]
MDNNKKKLSLKNRLVFGFFIGMLISVFVFFALYSVTKILLDDFFSSSSYVSTQEQKYVDSLQKYVTEHGMAATDFTGLRKWAKENEITVFSVSRERVLLYDNSYTGNAPLSETESLQLHKTWQYFHAVEFKDGPADVYIHKNYQRNYYVMALLIISGVSALVWALVLMLSFNRRIKYVMLLQEEINHQGDLLENSFTEKGNDELTEVARALNHLRNALLDSKAKETQYKKDREALILGMAHDLRTPLTGLRGYLEIIRRYLEEKDDLVQYVEKALLKTDQIRDLSDKLFDHFLSKNENTTLLEPPETAEYLLGDYLSELCSQLSVSGFTVQYDQLKWHPVCVQIDTDFVGRIFNNLIDNVIKYADSKRPVTLSSILTNEYLGIQIQNCRREERDAAIQGTHIGTQNIDAMMQKMNGKTEIEMAEDYYRITLFFPIIKIASAL